MKKLLMVLLTLSSVSAFAGLPSGEQRISDKTELLYLITSPHSELKDPNCIRKSILDSSVNRARIALGETITSVRTSYNFSDGKNVFEVQVFFKLQGENHGINGAISSAYCDLK